MKKLVTLLGLTIAMVANVLAQGYDTYQVYDPYNPVSRPVKQSANYASGASYGGSGGGELSYGYLSGHVAYNKFAGSMPYDSDWGWGADLGLELMKPLFLHVSLDRLTSSGPSPRKLEITTLAAGGGVYLPLHRRFHLVAEAGVSYDFLDGEHDVVYTDDFSVYLRPGIRFAATDKLELGASLLFSNTDNYQDFVVEVNAYYAVLSWFDVGAGVALTEDMNSYHVGGRWRW